MRPHEAPLVLSAQPVDRRSRIAATLALALSAALFLVLVPFAGVQLPAYPLFVPLNQAVLIVNDVVTATLLFVQLRVTRSRALMLLACGYVYSAAMAVLHLLSFPGVLGPQGVIGGGAQTTAYLYVFWHSGFALLALAYVLRKRREAARIRDARPPRVLRALAILFLAVAALLLAATAGNDLLPPLLQGRHYSDGFNVGRFGQWVLTAAAIVVLWRSRPHSVLDQWLFVVLFAWFIEIALVAIFNAGRYDVGFYAGRVYALLASCCVLVLLLWEQGRLYAGLLAAQETARSEAALRLADRRKDEFLATLAHELRNPLAPIRNAITVLKLLPALPPQVERVRDVVDRQSRHLARLVDDLLEVSRINQGKVQLRMTRVSLLEALHDALEATRPAIDAAGHTLAVSVPDDGLDTEGDGTRLTQVFANLLNNAAKFTPPGGRIELSAERAGEWARVVVRDNGIGIPPEHLEAIFGIFSQVTSARERTQGGLGIGLALVRGLVELHGGTVQAHSGGPQPGSEFVVRLPLHAAPRE